MFLQHIHYLNVGLGVHKLFGCDDRTLAAINQGADLDEWKSQRRALGELSIGELYKRGTRILIQLWDGNGIVEGLPQIIAQVFRCSTVIFMNVVMSGPNSLDSTDLRCLLRSRGSQESYSLFSGDAYTFIASCGCTQISGLANYCGYYLGFLD
jgi:hypothetical protein